MALRGFLAALVLLGAGCAHESHTAFTVPAPPEVVLSSAESQLHDEGQPAWAESPTRLVTPWQVVEHQETIMSTDSGPFEPVVELRRFVIVAQPEDAGTKVMVREDRATCPPREDQWRHQYKECVKHNAVEARERKTPERIGSELQARLKSTEGAG